MRVQGLGLLGFLGFVGFIGFIGLIGFIGFIGFRVSMNDEAVCTLLEVLASEDGRGQARAQKGLSKGAGLGRSPLYLVTVLNRIIVRQGLGVGLPGFGWEPWPRGA